MSNFAKSQKISVTCRTCGITESFYSSISVKHFKLNHAGHDIVDGSEVAPAEVRSVRQQAVTENNSEKEPGVRLAKVAVELANFPALSRPVFRIRGIKDDGEEAFVQVMVYEESAKVRGMLARGQHLDSGFSELLYVWEPEVVEYSEDARRKLGMRPEVIEPFPEPEPEPEVAAAAETVPESIIEDTTNTFDDSTVRAVNEEMFDRPQPGQEAKQDGVFPSFLGAPEIGDPVVQTEANWPGPPQPEIQVEAEPAPEPLAAPLVEPEPEPLAAPLPEAANAPEREPEPVRLPEPVKVVEPAPEPPKVLLPPPEPAPVRRLEPEPAQSRPPSPEPVKAPKLTIVETRVEPRLERITEPKRAPAPPPAVPAPAPKAVARPVLKPIERQEVRPEPRPEVRAIPTPAPTPAPIKVKQKKAIEHKVAPKPEEPEKEDYLLVSKSWYIEETKENRKEAVRISKVLSAYRWKVEPIYTIGVMIDDIVSIETSRNEFSGALIRKMEKSGYSLSAVTTDTGKPIAWFKRADKDDTEFTPGVSG